MAFRKPQPRKRLEPDVELALAAIEGTPNPLDMDLRGLDPTPTSLDMDGNEEHKVCSITCGICPACGRQLPMRYSRKGC